MIDPDFDPYEILANHAETLSSLIKATKDNSVNHLKLSQANKDLSDSLVRLFTDMQQLQHRITRLERQHRAFEQATADHRPKR